jgi:hypothetical protein
MSCTHKNKKEIFYEIVNSDDFANLGLFWQKFQ